MGLHRVVPSSSTMDAEITRVYIASAFWMLDEDDRRCQGCFVVAPSRSMGRLAQLCNSLKDRSQDVDQPPVRVVQEAAI
jgi:hypothetical protein